MNELISIEKSLFEELMRDKKLLDTLETVSCWIGVTDGGWGVKTKWAAGGDFVHTVREAAESFLLDNNGK